MKKAMALLAIAALFSLILAGCTAGTTTTTTSTTTPTGAPTTTATTTTSTSSGGSVNWDDVPVYSNATSVQKGSWTIPPAEGSWGTVAWKYYETADSTDKVTQFYDDQMPGNGWTEQANLNTAIFNWRFYTKNSENDAAMVWISSQNGQTVFALMRASK